MQCVNCVGVCMCVHTLSFSLTLSHSNPLSLIHSNPLTLQPSHTLIHSNPSLSHTPTPLSLTPSPTPLSHTLQPSHTLIHSNPLSRSQNEPFTSYTSDALFNMSRYLLHCMFGQDTPDGISRVYPLCTSGVLVVEVVL